MRTICYTVPGLEFMDRPMPELVLEDDVLVRIAYAGICGSDINIIHGHEDKFLGVSKGDILVLGHEGCGYVEKLGPKAVSKGLKVGDKVALYFNQYCGKCYYCRNKQEQFCENVKGRSGFFADFSSVNEQQVFKLPADTDMRKAALIEPISVVQRGIDIIRMEPGVKVAVIGCGSIGMLFTQLLAIEGAARLTVIEPVESKRKLALENGANFAIDPKNEDVIKTSKEISEGYGFDVVIETSGIKSNIQTGYDILGRGGTLELFAAYGLNSTYEVDLPSFFYKEAKIVGVFQSPYMYPRSLELYKRLNLEPFLQNIYKPEQWKEAFEKRIGGGPQKVLFEFAGNR